MSALLNHEPIRYFSWKGKTLNQVVSIIQKNESSTNEHNAEHFRAKPLKHYRRETLVIPNEHHISNERTSASVQAFERPNGFLVSSAEYCDRGLQTTLDVPLSDNKYNNGLCSTREVCQEVNARRRCRSAGMMGRKWDVNSNNTIVPTYSADTRQYLQSKHKSFERNDYHQIRQGEPSVLTGTATKGNVYSSGLNDCPKVFIPDDTNNTFFQYLWVHPFYSVTDASGVVHRYPATEEVTVVTGHYNLEELNFYLHKEMENRGHYIVNKITKVKRFFVKLVYNTYYDKIELQTYPVDATMAQTYSLPAEATWTWPTTPTCPCIRMVNNIISTAVGFEEGYYPNVKPWLDDAELDVSGAPVFRSTPYAILSQLPHRVFPMYKVVNYKPKNNRFAQQGAVDASTRTLMSKYDTMTRNGTAFAQAFSAGLANAMSYGIPEDVQTTKSKIGYNMKRTPIFPKYGETMIASCSRRKNMYN